MPVAAASGNNSPYIDADANASDSLALGGLGKQTEFDRRKKKK